MKYKMGDKVRVRSDLQLGKRYEHMTVVDNMLRHIGKIVTILRVDRNAYRIVEGGFSWTDDMFVSITEDSFEALINGEIDEETYKRITEGAQSS